MTVIDFASAKEKYKKIETIDANDVIPDEDAALQFAIAIAADIGVILDDMYLPLENDPKAMGDMYLIIDILKAMITRVAGIDSDSQRVSEMLIQDIDYDEHLEKFREIMETD